jgi:outer membrane usher protein
VGAAGGIDLALDTAFVLVPGAARWTAPVHDSFAVVVPARGLEGRRLLIDPRGQTAAAASDWFGPPVLPDLVSYAPHEIQVDTVDLPAGQRLGEDRPVLRPAYRSGLVVKVGSPARVQLRGSLADAEGRPLAFMSLRLRQAGAAVSAPPIELFTNRKGRFFSEPLLPGEYELLLPRSSAPLARIVVREDDDAPIDLQTLRLTSP